MKRIAIVLVTACAAAMVFAATPSELASDVIKLNPIKGAARVVATETTDARYTYFIWYKPGEGSVGRARVDTQRLVRATLALLVKQGVKPTEDWKFIHAHGVMAVPGETREMEAPLGDASYNFNTDQVEFEAPKR